MVFRYGDGSDNRFFISDGDDDDGGGGWVEVVKIVVQKAGNRFLIYSKADTVGGSTRIFRHAVSRDASRFQIDFNRYRPHN